MYYKCQKKGFTLTEVLIVVLVIAVLAAVAIPMYKRTIERSKASDAIHVLDTVSARQEVVWAETGAYAPDFAKLEAPVKGLNADGNAKVGNFTYAMNQACVVADKGSYKIYRNYITEETGCTGSDCAILKGLVTEGTVGCVLLNDNTTEEATNPPEADICEIDPAFCCKSGENWNGTSCVSCSSPKIWNSGSKNCVCGNICPGGSVPNTLTCVCACGGKCSGGKIATADCRCECPPETPNWNGSQCVPSCSTPRTRWTGSSCECPLSKSVYISSTNICIEACPQPKVWDGNDCICPSSLAGYRGNCISSGGVWNGNCSCDCGSPRTFLNGTNCVCPAPKTRFDGTNCACPQDREIYHSATNTCIGKCDSPLEWNFTALACQCPASSAPLRVACRDSGGVWSDKACSCSCAMPRQLNIATGLCECFAPRTRWTGSNCECPFVNPNWNPSAATCNPPCSDPKNYWDSSKCSCPPDKPKPVEVLNLCCYNTQGNICGGGIPNTIVGEMPCAANNCVCPGGAKLVNGYCCSNEYPNFINTSLGCCKTAAGGSACGGGIENSSKSGKINCLTGLCEACKGGTLRNNYCCTGNCTNGVYSGSGTATCNCVCNKGFKFNTETGNCDSCGALVNFTWTDNCNYSCNSGYCKDSAGKCTPLITGQWRNVEICQACTNKPANTSYTTAGGTSNNCSYSGNGGYCNSSGSYINIPVGQWRSGENCVACSNKHAYNTEYTTAGGTSNTCSWQCKSGYTSADGSCCLTSVKPALNQNCGACGYQARTLTCVNGNWTPGAWTACAEIARPEANQICGTCGYQIRTVTCKTSPTNPTWSIGGWGACMESPKPAINQTCGICGYQTRTVTCSPSATSPSWSAGGWGSCNEAAKPPTNQICGTCGYQTRTVTCNASVTNPNWNIGGWGGCSEAAKPPTNQICGTCGYQTRAVTCNPSSASPSWGTGGWNACSEASKPAVSAPCNGLSGDKTCGTAARTPICSASASSPVWSQPGWNTSACTAPIKGKESQPCGYNNTGTQTRTCYAVCSGESCTAWSACSGQLCNPATKPETSTPCGNIAGTNSCSNATRDVRCDNATWVALGWNTSSCYAPSCSQSRFATCASLGYECGGTAQRNCTEANCSGGNYSVWNTSACFNKYISSSDVLKMYCQEFLPINAYRGTAVRTCKPGCSGGECSAWDMSDCEVMPCPDSCDYGYYRDPAIQWRKDGDCCKPSKRCSTEDCEAKAPNGYIWTGSEFGKPDGSGCCQDACYLPHGQSTCSCYSYAERGENVCKCLGVGPYYFADSASMKDKCACDWYFSSNKQQCCKELGGSYNGSAQTCSATVYEWQIVYNSEKWYNAYSCPSGDIMSWICEAVLTNSSYFTNPEVDNLPICGKYCSSSQHGGKCKYCEIAYDRVCPGSYSGGGASVIKKTKTCVQSYKLL